MELWLPLSKSRRSAGRTRPPASLSGIASPSDHRSDPNRDPRSGRSIEQWRGHQRARRRGRADGVTAVLLIEEERGANAEQSYERHEAKPSSKGIYAQARSNPIERRSHNSLSRPSASRGLEETRSPLSRRARRRCRRPARRIAANRSARSDARAAARPCADRSRRSKKPPSPRTASAPAAIHVSARTTPGSGSTISTAGHKRAKGDAGDGDADRGRGARRGIRAPPEHRRRPSRSARRRHVPASTHRAASTRAYPRSRGAPPPWRAR